MRSPTRILPVLISLFCSLGAATQIPPVKLSYAEMFDSVCTKQTGFQIQSSWVKELIGRLPSLQTEWNTSGRPLLKMTTEIIGKGFQDSELSASLSVCNFPSLHDPLLINMRYSLASFASTHLPGDVTISIIFHEILHRYLNGRIPSHSALLKKYKAEDATVLSHLHLFSIQKAVYVKLGLLSILEDIVKKDETLPNPSYKRAWEIIGALEDYHSFLEELMNH